MDVMRSPLFVPGNRPNMLEKALGLTPDAFVPDLEDSVPPDEKENARNITASFLPRLASVGPPVIPRVNSLETGLMEDDLAAVVGPHAYGVSVGKVGSAEDVSRIAAVIDGCEAKAGLSVGTVKMVLWLETALAIVHAYEICVASPRTVAVAFGAEDFTNDMGIERTEAAAEVLYPRSAVSVAARAAGVLAIDTPYLALRDPEGLSRDALAARALGFRGKFAIHPEQIDTINRAFAPSAAEVEQAHRVVEAYGKAERSGCGATSLDGMVIDIPVVKRARQTLQMAEADPQSSQATER